MACCPSVLQGQNNVVSIQFFARPQGVRSNETSITSDESLPKSELFLEASLFATNAAGTTSDAAVGQSFRRAAGGANNSAGFEGKSAVNPWDFILLIEGAVVFAAAAFRKLECAVPGNLVYPFCVRQAGVGYGSASMADENHLLARIASEVR